MSTYFDNLTFGERPRLGIVALMFGPALLIVAARLAGTLSEGAAQVVETKPSEVDPAVEGKPVDLVGDLRADGTLHDPEFDVRATGVALIRKVEIYE